MGAQNEHDVVRVGVVVEARAGEVIATVIASPCLTSTMRWCAEQCWLHRRHELVRPRHRFIIWIGSVALGEPPEKIDDHIGGEVVCGLHGLQPAAQAVGHPFNTRDVPSQPHDRRIDDSAHPLCGQGPEGSLSTASAIRASSLPHSSG